MPSNFSKIPKSFAAVARASASESVLSLDELKKHARIPEDLSDDDAQLTRLCGAAESLIEKQAEIALRQQTWRLRLARLPWDNHFGLCGQRSIRLEMFPVQSVTAGYFDENDVLQTVDPAAITLEADCTPPIICLPDTIVLSTTKPLPLAITAVCGYADPDAIPEEAKVAIAQLVAHWYRFREAVGLAPTQAHPEVYRIFSDLIEALRWRVYP